MKHHGNDQEPGTPWKIIIGRQTGENKDSTKTLKIRHDDKKSYEDMTQSMYEENS